MAAVSDMMRAERCGSCRHFIPPNKCQEMRAQDRVDKDGWCKLFSRGTPLHAGAKPSGEHTPKELGYHE